MKKAIEITSVIIEAGRATVTYSTGTVRRYPTDKLPGTVTSWLATRPAEEQAGEAPEAAPEAAGRTDKEEAAEVEAVAVASPQLPTAAPAAQVATVAAAEAIAQDQPRAATAGLWPLAWLALSLLDALTDAYFWATTWIPIGIRRLVFLLTWDVLPVARKAAARAAMAMAFDILPAVVRGAIWMAGAMVRAARAAARGCKALVSALASAWAFRSDLIRESKAA